MPFFRFHKLRGRSIIRPLLFLIAFVLWFEGCTLPKEPGSLWWDVDLIVPLGERTYGIWDLTDPDSVLRVNSSGIGMDEDSNAYFSIWTETSIAIEDCLYIQPLQFEAMRPVDAIQMPIDLDTTFNYSLGALNADVAALHGTTQDIESHLLLAQQNFTADELVEYAIIDTGTARFVVINSLPYPVMNLSVVWKAEDNSSSILNIDSIGSGQQLVLNGLLANAVTQSATSLELIGDGIGGQAIQVDSTDGITIAIQVDTVTCNYYDGRLPAQMLYGDTTVTIDSQHLIEYATIRSGSVQIELVNGTQVDDSMTLVIPAIVNQLGDSVYIKRFVTAGETYMTSLNLEGFRILLTGVEPQQVEGRLYVESQQTSDERHFESGSEYAIGRATLSGLIFDFFRGTLRDMQLPIGVTGIPVERPPAGWESVHPTVANAYVHFAETFGGAGYANLNLRTLFGETMIGESNIITPEMTLEADTFAVVPGLTGLLSEYPDSAAIEGTLTVNGYVSTMDNAELSVAVAIESPLMITLTDFHPPGTIELIDTGDLKDIKSGTAEVTIRNRLPVGGQVFVIAARDSLELLVDSGADVDTVIIVSIPEPEVTDGQATGIATTERSVLLSESVIDMLQNPPFYTRTDIQIPGTNGDTLLVHGSDYVSLRILARLVYEIRTGEDY